MCTHTTCILVHTHTCTYPYLYIPILVHTHTCTYPYLYIPILVHTHTCTYPYLCIPILVHTPTCTVVVRSSGLTLGVIILTLLHSTHTHLMSFELCPLDLSAHCRYGKLSHSVIQSGAGISQVDEGGVVGIDLLSLHHDTSHHPHPSHTLPSSTPSPMLGTTDLSSQYTTQSSNLTPQRPKPHELGGTCVQWYLANALTLLCMYVCMCVCVCVCVCVCASIPVPKSSLA